MPFLIFSILLETACGILVFFPFLLLWQLWRRKEQTVWHRLFVFIFAAYLAAVFSVTGMPDFSIWMKIPDPSINCIPFAALLNNPLQYALNILLFLPAGLLLPMMWPYFRKVQRTALFGFCLSLWIELGQLLTFRTTDIDDLTANTAGAVLGFALWRLIARRFQTRAGQQTKKADLIELFFTFFCVCLSMFFLQPLLSNCVWNLLYNEAVR